MPTPCSPYTTALVTETCSYLVGVSGEAYKLFIYCNQNECKDINRNYHIKREETNIKICGLAIGSF